MSAEIEQDVTLPHVGSIPDPRPDIHEPIASRSYFSKAKDHSKYDHYSRSKTEDTLLNEIGTRIKIPLAEICVHFLVTVASIVSIYIIEISLYWCGLAEKKVPCFDMKLEEWMFTLEVLAASLIISIGILKAVIALARS